MLTRTYMTPESNKKLVAYTPMLHSRLMTETTKFRDNHFRPLCKSLDTKPPFPLSAERSDLHLDGNPSIDRPLFVQFCANDPQVLLDAAEYVAPFCDAVDLNLGCPQGIAKKGAYGSFLQENQELIYRLINILHLNLAVPVTAKIRILENKERTLEYAKRVLSAGASVLTVHGRVREAKGHKTGLADWSYIRYLRENLPKETVIFANGNVLVRGDIGKCLQATGADAVMSAEGNLYDPAVFAEPPAVGEEGTFYWRAKDGRGGFRMDDAMRRYMDILYKYVLKKPAPVRRPLYIPGQAAVEALTETTTEDNGEPPRKRVKIDTYTAEPAPAATTNGTLKNQEKKQEKKKKFERTSNPNLVAMQAHCFHMLRALVNKHHNVRDALARSRAGDIEAYEEVLRLVESVCEGGMREYEATGGESWEREVEEMERKNGVVKTDNANGEAEVETFETTLTKEGDLEDGKLTTEPVSEVSQPNEAYETSVQAVRECRRPWWVMQPYIRPLPLEAVLKGSLTLSKKEMANLSPEEREKAAAMGAYKNMDIGTQPQGVSKKEAKRLRKEEAKAAAKAKNGKVEGAFGKENVKEGETGEKEAVAQQPAVNVTVEKKVEEKVESTIKVSAPETAA